MNIYIRGEKLEITDAMKSYAKEKLERLSKYVKDSDVNANLLFKINGIKQKLEVTIPLKNFTLRVEEVGNDFYAVVDTAVDKLERQIRKNKTRLENKQVKSKVDFDFMSFDEKDEENANKIVRRKQVELKPMDEEEARATAKIVGLAALKYGDLSNQASKDYVFDIERFASFEGNTGPYILYTIVRIKSILNKYTDSGKTLENLSINPADSATEKALMLSLAKFSEIMAAVYTEKAPHKLCQFIYEVSNAFNGFYHDTKILAETDEAKQKGYIALICLTKAVLEQCIELLAIECPDRM